MVNKVCRRINHLLKLFWRIQRCRKRKCPHRQTWGPNNRTESNRWSRSQASHLSWRRDDNCAVSGSRRARQYCLILWPGCRFLKWQSRRRLRHDWGT